MVSPSTTSLQQSLADTLLVQADAANYRDAAECSDRIGGGLALTGDKGLTVAEYLLDHQGYPRPVLADRGRYAGTGRKFAHEAFDATWIRRQRRLGLAAIMPDAGYVGEGDEPGLVNVLTRTKYLGENAVAPLALHLSWLNTKNGRLAMLTDHILATGVPIAIALEHPKDPLSPRYAVNGLISLLAQPIQVIMLRCDVSAIGALCFGSLSAAVGSSTGLRHIYPLPKPGSSGFGNPAHIAAIVRGCLAYVWFDKIDQAVQADRDNQVWWCECRVCGGQTLDWLASSPAPETVAYLHSLEMLYQIRNDLLGRATSMADRKQSWIAQCDSAMFQHLDIQDSIYRWEPPAALGNWASYRSGQVTGNPAS
jgi:hypothetical protein